jgi:hypothetical protein
METHAPPAKIFDYASWSERVEELGVRYRAAEPYPHAFLDNFLDSEAAGRAMQAFPSLGSDDWINYTHYNEKKFGLTELDRFPGHIKEIIQELNSQPFLDFLSNLTGIPGLLADTSLEGGGLHQTPSGGFLNVHADFTAHPHQPKWRRRVNLLVYLNEGWQEDWGGHLEVWDRHMKACHNRILPLFNRAVIFNTDKDTFHGHPDPMTCPEDVTRKSIALYYFTEEEHVVVQSTEYRPRPEDGALKGMLIFVDKIVLRIYDRVKRIFGLDDKFASKLLKMLRGGKK